MISMLICQCASFEIQVNIKENIIRGRANITKTIGLIIQCLSNDNCSLKTILNSCFFDFTLVRVKAIRIKMVEIKLTANGAT